MKSQIFITISVPEKIKKRLLAISEKWSDLPIIPTKGEKLRINLVSVGFVEKDLIPEICEKSRAICQEAPSFELGFQKIHLFPDEINPKYILLSGEKNEDLKNLLNLFEEKLNFSKVKRNSFSPKIILGIVKKSHWKEKEDKRNIDESFSFNFSVDQIEIMANNFENNPKKQVVVEICPLGN